MVLVPHLPGVTSVSAGPSAGTSGAVNFFSASMHGVEESAPATSGMSNSANRNSDFNFMSFSVSFQPQNRLRDGNVAADFLVRRIGRKFLPQVEIFFFVEHNSGEQQTRLACGPIVPGLHIRLAWPLRFIGENPLHEFHGLAAVSGVG